MVPHCMDLLACKSQNTRQLWYSCNQLYSTPQYHPIICLSASQACHAVLLFSSLHLARIYTVCMYFHYHDFYLLSPILSNSPMAPKIH